LIAIRGKADLTRTSSFGRFSPISDIDRAIVLRRTEHFTDCYTGGCRLGANMKRREFITLLGSVAAGWPVIVRAQQGGRVRLVCILEGVSQDTPNADARYTAFAEGLQQLGWTPGRNLKIERRWGGGDEAAIRK
jgi:hypothetical protein